MTDKLNHTTYDPILDSGSDGEIFVNNTAPCVTA